MNKRFLVLAAAAAAALTVAAPLAAQAHVRVSPDQVTAGSYAVLTFRVPNESATASTSRLEVDFPAGAFASVSYQTVPGWTGAIARDASGKPSSVTWTATPGSEIGPGQFQQFVVSAGPVPTDSPILLPAIQTYTDGTVVSWDQPATGSDEPEHPAPTLTVTPASTATGAPSATGASGPDAADVTGLALGLGALVVAAVALVVALVRRRGAST